MAACQDYTCGGYEDVEEWTDEIQQFATGGVASNLPTVLAKCQEAVQSSVSPRFKKIKSSQTFAVLHVINAFFLRILCTIGGHSRS